MTPKGGQPPEKPWLDSRYYLAPVAGVGWLIGIWLGSVAQLTLTLWLLLGVLFSAGASLLWLQGRVGLILAGFAALSFGGARYLAAQPAFDPNHLYYYNGMKNAIIVGAVRSEPENYDTFTQLRVDASQVMIDG